MFSRYEIHEKFVSDIGLSEYALEDIANIYIFAAEYGFEHITSSPRCAQTYGKVERAVQTVKALLNKEDDPHLCLFINQHHWNKVITRFLLNC